MNDYRITRIHLTHPLDGCMNITCNPSDDRGKIAPCFSVGYIKRDGTGNYVAYNYIEGKQRVISIHHDRVVAVIEEPVHKRMTEAEPRQEQAPAAA